MTHLEIAPDRRCLPFFVILLISSFVYLNTFGALMKFDSIASHYGTTTRDSIVGFGKRFSFHTNMIDWAIAMPNVGVELDMSGKPTNRYSIGIHLKYRPSLYNKVTPRFVFNTIQVRGEFRRYWRTFVYDDYSKISTRATSDGRVKIKKVMRKIVKWNPQSVWLSGDQWMKEGVDSILFDSAYALKQKEGFLRYFYRRYLSGAQKYKARDWRAYYIGVYAEIDRFTYNLNKNGRQGYGGGFGLTAGYTMPIYPMRNGASIDLDIGLSIGARIHEYDKFTYEEETHCYVYTGRKERTFVKYPTIADVHVSFVYRFNSINNKVKGCADRFNEQIDRYEVKLKSNDKKDTVQALENLFRARLDTIAIYRAKHPEDSLYNPYDKRYLKKTSKSVKKIDYTKRIKEDGKFQKGGEE